MLCIPHIWLLNGIPAVNIRNEGSQLRAYPNAWQDGTHSKQTPGETAENIHFEKPPVTGWIVSFRQGECHHRRKGMTMELNNNKQQFSVYEVVEHKTSFRIIQGLLILFLVLCVLVFVIDAVVQHEFSFSFLFLGALMGLLFISNRHRTPVRTIAGEAEMKEHSLIITLKSARITKTDHLDQIIIIDPTGFNRYEYDGDRSILKIVASGHVDLVREDGTLKSERDFMDEQIQFVIDRENSQGLLSMLERFRERCGYKA